MTASRRVESPRIAAAPRSGEGDVSSDAHEDDTFQELDDSAARGALMDWDFSTTRRRIVGMLRRLNPNELE
jgi:hypothetical protein